MPNKMLEELKKKMADPEFMARVRKDFQEKERRKEINRERTRKFFHDQASFEGFLSKLFLKEWDQLNLVDCLFEIVSEEGEKYSEPFDDLTKHFPTYTALYMNHYFSVTYGQGSVLSVYNPNKELIFRS